MMGPFQYSDSPYSLTPLCVCVTDDFTFGVTHVMGGMSGQGNEARTERERMDGSE